MDKNRKETFHHLFYCALWNLRHANVSVIQLMKFKNKLSIKWKIWERQQRSQPHNCIMVICSGCRKKMRQEAMPANLFISPWLSMNLATSKSYNCSQRMRIYHQWRYSRSLFHSLKTIPRRLWTFFFFDWKQHHWRNCASPSRWCFEGEEFTRLCKFKFHSSFSLIFFFKSVTLWPSNTWSTATQKN